MKSFFVVLFVLASACARITVGKDFDQTELGQIAKGKTSREEVVKILGEPAEKTTEAGLERWIYIHRVTSATPGLQWLRLSYRGDVKERRLVIVFGGDTVQDVLFSEHSKPYVSSLGFN